MSEFERQNERMTTGAAEMSHATLDEEAMLVRRCLDGDQGAFDRLYARYREKVYVLAMGILMDAEDAADAVQDTFSLAYRNLGRFKQQSRFGTWLFRIAVNASIQLSRKRKNRALSSELDDSIAVPAPQEDEQTIDAALVSAAMAKLKPDDRAVLTLFYWEDLPLEQIGESLGCAANAAKTRLYRARERFRAELVKLQKEHA